MLIASRRAENLQAAAQSIADASGRRVEICATDLRALAGCEAVHELAKRTFGRVDILVNRAGATKGGRFVEQPDSEWEAGFALRFYGAVRLSRLLWPFNQVGTLIQSRRVDTESTPHPTKYGSTEAVNGGFLNNDIRLRPLQKIDSLNEDASAAALRPSNGDLISWNGLRQSRVGHQG